MVVYYANQNGNEIFIYIKSSQNLFCKKLFIWKTLITNEWDTDFIILRNVGYKYYFKRSYLECNVLVR